MTALSEKIALVTGASRGLGYALARSLAAEGAHVIALARTAGGLEELDDEIQAAGGAATLTPLDLKDDPGLERLGAAIHERWGRLDILAHCAATPAPLSPAEHAAPTDLDGAVATNFRATQRLIRVVDPLLKATDEAQAVFLDDPDVLGAKFFGAYSASKAAARALALSYAAETARIGPRVWLAVPQPMPTALRGRFHPGENRDALVSCDEMAAKLTARIVAADAEPGATVRL